MSVPYSADAFLHKLASLQPTADGIPALSRWVLKNRENSGEIVHLLVTELYKVPVNRKIIFLYLCNDIMQTSQRETNDFIGSLSPVLPKAIEETMKGANEEIKAKLNRMIAVWKERNVLPSDVLNRITNIKEVKIEGIVIATPQTKSKVAPAPIPLPIKENSFVALPEVLRELINVYQQTIKEEPKNFIAENVLNASAKDTIFPWNESRKSGLSPHIAPVLLSDVEKTFNAAISLKEKLERDLERRANLVTLINQLKDKQEAVLDSHFKKLRLCLQFLDNINQARNDLQEYTSLSGSKRYPPPFPANSAKLQKVNHQTDGMSPPAMYPAGNTYPFRGERTITDMPPALHAPIQHRNF